MGVLGGGWTMESGGGQGRGGWIKESVNLVSVGGLVCVCVGVLSVGLGPGLDSMSPARSRRSASHAAGTHGWLPQKTGRPGLRRGGVGGYNMHSVPPNSPPDCGTPTTSRLYPFGARVASSMASSKSIEKSSQLAFLRLKRLLNGVGCGTLTGWRVTQIGRWIQNMFEDTKMRFGLYPFFHVALLNDFGSFALWMSDNLFKSVHCSTAVVVVYPLPWPLLVGGVRCSRLWSTSQLLRPSGQQCSHSGGVCPQIQGRQCGAYVGAVLCRYPLWCIPRGYCGY